MEVRRHFKNEYTHVCMNETIFLVLLQLFHEIFSTSKRFDVEIVNLNLRHAIASANKIHSMGIFVKF